LDAAPETDRQACAVIRAGLIAAAALAVILGVAHIADRAVFMDPAGHGFLVGNANSLTGYQARHGGALVICGVGTFLLTAVVPILADVPGTAVRVHVADQLPATVGGENTICGPAAQIVLVNPRAKALVRGDALARTNLGACGLFFVSVSRLGSAASTIADFAIGSFPAILVTRAGFCRRILTDHAIRSAGAALEGYKQRPVCG
jgi:hypothetical protein